MTLELTPPTPAQFEALMSEYEKRYCSVVSNLKEVVFQTDAEGRWLFLNPAWAEITGFTVEESLGQVFLNYVHPDDRELNAERFVPLIERKKSDCRHEIRYLTKDGGYRWIEVWARLTLDEHDDIIGTSGTLSDVTARKEAELALERERAALEEANLKLKEADRYKDEFLSVISHELRNPLTIMTGVTTLLEEGVHGDLNDMQTSAVGKLRRAADRMIGLIDELLDLAKVQAGRLQVFVRPIDFDRLLSEVSRGMGVVAAAKGIEVSVEQGTSYGTVELDEARIHQVLLNLVGNAIKFTPEGGHIRLSARRDDHLLRVEVTDDGPGIAPEDIAKLFQRFNQLEQGLNRQHSGAGLGLAISKAIVEAHGGEIGCYSQPGEGSTFWFTLPSLAAPQA